MKIKGQVLLFVMLFMALALLLCGGLMQVWQSQVQIPSLHEQGMRAYYLAQAGIEQAKRQVVNDVTFSGLFPPSGWDNSFDVSGDNYNFEYNFSVSALGTTRIVTANGRVTDVSGNPPAQKQIVVTITGISPGGLGSSDSDNVGSVTVWD